MSSLSSRTRSAPAGFIEPCLPSPADKPPSGANWIHEIKHDGYRLMARRDPVGIRLLTRNGHDWAARYPLIVEAVNHLRVRSVLIDGEVVCCDDRGLAIFRRYAQAERGDALSSIAFDLLELDGTDMRREPIEVRKATLASILRKSRPGVRLNEHLEHPTARWCSPRLQDGRGGDRVEAARIALPVGPVAGLAEVQEPGGAGGEAGGRGGLALMPHPEWSAMSSEQKMEFLYNWCFQMSEVVQEHEQPHRRSWTRSSWSRRCSPSGISRLQSETE